MEPHGQMGKNVELALLEFVNKSMVEMLNTLDGFDISFNDKLLEPL